VLRKLRADWRRGRALKTLKLGERQYWEWDSDTEAGRLCAELMFRPEGETVVLVFFSIYAKDVLEKGEYQAQLGLAGGRRFLEMIAQIAADAGFSRLAVAGQRTKRHFKRGERQRVEWDLARYLRGGERAR
jgi:hypothetical protein